MKKTFYDNLFEYDDGTLDVLDVVSLVQEILNGGMGDVGDLLNIVRG